MNFDKGLTDHVHFLFELQQLAGVDLSKFITSLKSMTSRKLKTIDSDFSWSSSYYLGTVSKEGGKLEAVRNYIKEQHRND